ncbi:hypothetical protein ACH5RR_023183 [Cinchona calisaya]|uniref:Uncharacterized protein n=1 Tax=Cinchona calisaya TaxID=153742 RepID=A0ABD2ZBT7_9GENT
MNTKSTNVNVNSFRVRLRGKLHIGIERPVPFGKDIINAHYGLPDVAEESNYARFLRGNIDKDEVLGFLIDNSIPDGFACWEMHNR